MKTKLTNMVEYLTYDYLYLKRGYRLALEVTIPYDLFKEVNIPNGVKHGLPIVDIMGVSKHRQVICVEIKTTFADFKSKNGHNFYGNYNYYAVPLDLVDKIMPLVPPHVGIIAVTTVSSVYEVGKHKTTYYTDPRIAKNAKLQKIDFLKQNQLTRENILEQVQYNIITAQTSSILTLMKNNIEREEQ